MMQAMLVMMMMVMTKVASSGRCFEEVLVQVQAATAISFPPTRKSGRHSFSVQIFSGGSSEFFAFFDHDHDHDHDHDDDCNNDDGQNHYGDETRQSKSRSLPHVISRPTRP